MAYFRCQQGSSSGGAGATITVTYDSSFYNKTMTCTNGTKTYTKTTTSSGSTTFNVNEEGTWTITCNGVSVTVAVVLSYSTQMKPTGSTATPVNNIQTWLKCGGIFDKTYTTINQVLADTTTLLALISDSNAVDYMVRSTNWASSVCANSTAMTYIGNNNYCANKLLANSTWKTAICNSTYFESVLKVKVPTMTSNTTPSGKAFADTEYGNDYKAWKAFDKKKEINNGWVSATSGYPHYLGYDFGSAIKVSKVIFNNFAGNLSYAVKTYKIQGSNSKDSGYVDLTDTLTNTNTDTNDVVIILNNTTFYRYYRIYVTDGFHGTRCDIGELQFYGRS